MFLGNAKAHKEIARAEDESSLPEELGSLPFLISRMIFCGW